MVYLNVYINDVIAFRLLLHKSYVWMYLYTLLHGVQADINE